MKPSAPEPRTESASSTRGELAGFAQRVLIFIGLVGVAAFLWAIAEVLLLAFGGVLLATVLRALARPLTRHTPMSEPVAVVAVLLLLIGALGTAGYFFGQAASAQSEQLWQALPQAAARVEETLSRSQPGQMLLEGLRGVFGSASLERVTRSAVTAFGGLADTLLIVAVAVYFALAPRDYRRGLASLVPLSARARVDAALDEAGESLRRWLAGQGIAMLAVGVLTGLGLWAIGVPQAFALGAVAGLLEFVPLVGPLLAAVPGILLAFATGPEMALYAALVYFGVQLLEENLIVPLAQRWAVELPPALGLLAIVAFGLVFGVIGVLFATPLVVAIVALVRKLYVEPVASRR